MGKKLIKDRLLKLIREKAVLRGNFTLSSGETSDCYLDLRKVTLNAQGLYFITHLMYDRILECDNDINLIGGPELSAVPIISSIIQYSYRMGYSIDGFVVRNKPKQYGTIKIIEGNVQVGNNIVVIDDVATTGNSMLRTSNHLSEMRCKTDLMMVIVDRGGGKRLEKKGFKFFSIFDYDEIIAD